MKILVIYIRGERYHVNEAGQMVRTDMPMQFHDSWQFLGGSRHHWSRHIDINLKQAFVAPELLKGCLLWDKDHGTVRQWGGSYCGKLPRITSAYISQLDQPVDAVKLEKLVDKVFPQTDQ
jgi:hypothetical protein